MRDVVEEFPEIRGYVLLTEGFWYQKWGGAHGASEEYVQDWAQNWCKAVGIVAEECHRVDPTIEVSRDPVTRELHAMRGTGFATVQFHPESVLTEHGVDLLGELLDHLGVRAAGPVVQ